MIKSITVTNPRDESLEMVLTDPEKSGFVITEITGLNPPKADINSTELVTGDGAVFNSSRITSRNITITMKYLKKPSIEACRELSYRLFPVGQKIRLTITTDLRTCYIDGYVESNEAVIFSSQTYTQISIICPQPQLLDKKDTRTIFSGSIGLFEFPIENGGVEFPIDDPLEFSYVLYDFMKNIDYTGEIETGFVAEMRFLGRVRGLGLHNYYTREVIQIDTDKLETIIGDQIDNGDILTLNTITGQKGIQYIKDGLKYNILNCVNKDAIWFQLKQGNNVFYYTAEEGIENIQFSVYNHILYQGV